MQFWIRSNSIEITSSATALSMGCPTALFSVWLNHLRAARSACPAVASSTCKRSAQARITVSGRGGLANASPVRDERIANLEQRGPRSGDARELFAYYLFCKKILLKQEHGGPTNDRLH